MHPRNGLMVVVAVMLAVVATAQAGEKADSLPEGIVGYLATTRAEHLDGELLKVFQGFSGNLPTPGQIPLNKIYELGQTPPVFEMMLGGFLGLDMLHVNPKGAVRMALVENMSEKRLDVVATLPLYPFSELKKEAGDRKSLELMGIDGDVVKLSPEPGQAAGLDIVLYIADMGGNAIMLADSPEALEKARKIFAMNNLPVPASPAEGGAKGFAATLWFDLAKPMGELLFASLTASMSGRMLEKQSRVQSPLASQLSLSLLRMCAQSKAFSVSASIINGSISAQAGFSPRENGRLAKSIEVINSTPKPKKANPPASLPDDTSMFVAWEGGRAVSDTLLDFLNISDLYGDDALSTLRMTAFMRDVLRGGESNYTTAGITREGEAYICIAPENGQVAEALRDKHPDPSLGIDKVAVSKELDRAMIYFSSKKGRDAEQDLSAIAEGRTVLGSRANFPPEFLNPRERVIAVSMLYIPELIATAFVGKGIFAPRSDDNNVFRKWFRNRMRNAMKEYNLVSRHPLAAAVSVTKSGDLQFGFRGSLGMFKEMIDTYQRMMGGMTPYHRGLPGLQELSK